MKRLLTIPALVLAGTMTMTSLSSESQAQTASRTRVSGFNVFSVEQDVEIGKQSAAEAEQQLRLLNDRATDTYLTRIVQRLVPFAPGAKYPYTVKAVNSTEINAFALPGGPLYVNRGLITAARSEAELAGVIAHELSHIALRHGTNQASKAYMGQAGLSILGGLLGSRKSSDIIIAVGGFGLNAAFLKFSRDDENEADEAGARMMASAGYNPIAMADFFGVLRQQQGRDPGKLERFFSSHPAPANREARIRSIASTLGNVNTREIGGFASVRNRLSGIAVATTETQYPTTTTSSGTIGTTQPVTVSVASPSSTFVRFSHPTGFFQVEHPDNWRAYAPATGQSLSLAPAGGVVEGSDGTQALVYGVIINHYVPFDGTSERVAQSLQRSYAPFEDRTKPRGGLEDATDDLVRTIQRANPYLTSEFGSARRELIDGAPSYAVQLNGRSPLTGQDEMVTVNTRALADGHVMYLLCVAPTRVYSEMSRACNRMMRTMVIDDDAAHRAGRVGGSPR